MKRAMEEMMTGKMRVMNTLETHSLGTCTCYACIGYNILLVLVTVS